MLTVQSMISRHECLLQPAQSDATDALDEQGESGMGERKLEVKVGKVELIQGRAKKSAATCDKGRCGSRRNREPRRERTASSYSCASCQSRSSERDYTVCIRWIDLTIRGTTGIRPTSADERRHWQVCECPGSDIAGEGCNITFTCMVIAADNA